MKSYIQLKTLAVKKLPKRTERLCRQLIRQRNKVRREHDALEKISQKLMPHVTGKIVLPDLGYEIILGNTSTWSDRRKKCVIPRKIRTHFKGGEAGNTN